MAVTRNILAILTVLLAVSPAGAQTTLKPTDALRVPLDKALAIMQDHHFRQPGEKQAQTEKLWELIRQAYDFEGITERAVGRNWKLFSAEQKKQFIDVFTTLLGNSYISKIQGNFHDSDKVDFLGEEMLGGDKAIVKSMIVREVDSFPVDYRVRALGGTWRIYDVNIEGVSLVANYRSQFDQILSKDSPDVLIERVRAKNKAKDKEKQ
jgi:phospholipid transport system substrate-binding protein